MEPINVKSISGDYLIHIGSNIRFNLEQYFTKKYSAIMIITDEDVAQLYLNDLVNSLSHTPVYQAIMPSGEQAKQWNTFYQLHTEAIQSHLDRQSLIIALGGGVVGDVAGFVAATFMRGIDYIQVPTTILAHDSSVGGKVAINHELGKNLIGCFYPPVAVVYDISTLQSLDKRDIRSGYAEIMKEAMIADEPLYQQLLDLDLQTVTEDQLYNHLYSGIQIKKEIVTRDEKEAGDRMFLNLGHTLGHALEAMEHYQSILHGEAVAIGLLFSTYVSEQYFQTDLNFSNLYQWLNRNDYPTQLQNIDKQSLLKYIKTDKKVVNDDINIVLLKQIAQPTLISMSHEQIAQYVYEFFERFNELC